MKNNKLVSGVLAILFFIILASINPASVRAASVDYHALFDADYYYQAYSDVAAACGKDASALYAHFRNYGIKEGRSGNAEFNVDAYRARYSDLDEAFGDHFISYYNHYLSYGKAEGRIATTDGKPYAGARMRNSAATDTNSKMQKTDISELQKKLRRIVANNLLKKADGEKAKEENKETNGSSDTNVVGTKTDSLADTDADGSGASSNVSAKTTKETTTKSAPLKAPVSGTYTTYYNEAEARAVNVKLAAERINGVVVQPGDTFSFSETVLPRTAENGYVIAPVILNRKMSQGIGGGICQVSSTLYAAMITAEIPATERHAHSLSVDYVPKGMDATISGDKKDLKFKNIYDKPLTIAASALDGKLVITIGMQE